MERDKCKEGKRKEQKDMSALGKENVMLGVFEAKAGEEKNVVAAIQPCHAVQPG